MMREISNQPQNRLLRQRMRARSLKMHRRKEMRLVLGTSHTVDQGTSHTADQVTSHTADRGTSHMADQGSQPCFQTTAPKKVGIWGQGKVSLSSPEAHLGRVDSLGPLMAHHHCSLLACWDQAHHLLTWGQDLQEVVPWVQEDHRLMAAQWVVRQIGRWAVHIMVVAQVHGTRTAQDLVLGGIKVQGHFLMAHQEDGRGSQDKIYSHECIVSELVHTE